MVRAMTYRQTVGFQSGHAASGGGPGVQHVLLCHFKLSALRRHVAIPHGHQNWFFIAAIQPLLGLHGGLRPHCVWIQVVLEEVRLDGRVHKVKKKTKQLSLLVEKVVRCSTSV